jgi:hypothetical protein
MFEKSLISLVKTIEQNSQAVIGWLSVSSKKEKKEKKEKNGERIGGLSVS